MRDPGRAGADYFSVAGLEDDAGGDADAAGGAWADERGDAGGVHHAGEHADLAGAADGKDSFGIGQGDGGAGTNSGNPCGAGGISSAKAGRRIGASREG